MAKLIKLMDGRYRVEGESGHIGYVERANRYAWRALSEFHPTSLLFSYRAAAVAHLEQAEKLHMSKQSQPQRSNT